MGGGVGAGVGGTLAPRGAIARRVERRAAAHSNSDGTVAVVGTVPLLAVERRAPEQPVNAGRVALAPPGQCRTQGQISAAMVPVIRRQVPTVEQGDELRAAGGTADAVQQFLVGQVKRLGCW